MRDWFKKEGPSLVLAATIHLMFGTLVWSGVIDILQWFPRGQAPTLLGWAPGLILAMIFAALIWRNDWRWFVYQLLLYAFLVFGVIGVSPSEPEEIMLQGDVQVTHYLDGEELHGRGRMITYGELLAVYMSSTIFDDGFGEIEIDEIEVGEIEIGGYPVYVLKRGEDWVLLVFEDQK